MNLNCTIDWIRHAESCNNLYDGHPMMRETIYIL